MVAGTGMMVFFTRRGCRLWKAGWLCRRASADAASTDGGRRVVVVDVWVDFMAGWMVFVSLNGRYVGIGRVLQGM